jgi:hypothetical protein
MPTFKVTGSQASRYAGGSFKIDPAMALLGLNVPKPSPDFSLASTKWPPPPPGLPLPSFPVLMAGQLSDDDGDGNPGLTVTSTSGNGYQFAPTSIDFDHSGANNLYFVNRTQLSLVGTIGADCKTGAGTAMVPIFDNHVVGCTDGPGESSLNCGTHDSNSVLTGYGFIDNNRPLYLPGSATYVAARVSDTATCADVRAAVP